MDRTRKRGNIGAFQHHFANARFPRLEFQIRHLVQRKKNDRNARKIFQNFRRGAQPIHHGHRKIENDKIRTQRAGEMHRLQAVHRLAAQAPAAGLSGHVAMQLAHRFAIVGDENFLQ